MPYKNIDSKRKWNKEWAAKNRELYRENSRLWRVNNPEKEKENSARWYQNHKESLKKYLREYLRDNPDRVRAYYHTRRTRQSGAGGTFTATEWKDLCKNAVYRCLCCSKRRKLTADHVIPVSKGGSSNIENIQPLCGPCNSRKHDGTTDFRR